MNIPRLRHLGSWKKRRLPLRLRLALWSGALVLVLSFGLLLFINWIAFSSFHSIIRDRTLLAKKLQEALPNAHVVKSMNSASMTLITNPTRIGPSSVFLSGDSAEAKAETAGLLRDLGWTDDEIVDLGGSSLHALPKPTS